MAVTAMTLKMPVDWLLLAPLGQRLLSLLSAFGPRGLCGTLPGRADAAHGHLFPVIRCVDGIRTRNRPIRVTEFGHFLGPRTF